jgi:hypothetical protein
VIPFVVIDPKQNYTITNTICIDDEIYYFLVDRNRNEVNRLSKLENLEFVVKYKVKYELVALYPCGKLLLCIGK